MKATFTPVTPVSVDVKSSVLIISVLELFWWVKNPTNN